MGVRPRLVRVAGLVLRLGTAEPAAVDQIIDPLVDPIIARIAVALFRNPKRATKRDN
jgi:hypothetical protein